MDAAHTKNIDSLTDHVNQYLTFMLGNEEYGVEILRVQEVKGWEAVRSIPNLPSYIKGVINLRGQVIPIICLRERLGMPLNSKTGTTVVIVLRVQTETDQSIIGIVADAVSEVYNIEESMMQPTPNLGSGVDVSFIRAVATMNEKMVVLLEIDKLLQNAVPAATQQALNAK
ncbi:MAG: chemotaxis protein CheW [Gammaproteobacteria bacterium]|nr:chemotaxis protein CheW [Gammaproteobacteria bacterium]